MEKVTCQGVILQKALLKFSNSNNYREIHFTKQSHTQEEAF